MNTDINNKTKKSKKVIGNIGNIGNIANIANTTNTTNTENIHKEEIPYIIDSVWLWMCNEKLV